MGRLVSGGELSSQQSSSRWRQLATESTGEGTKDLLQSRQQNRFDLIKSTSGQRRETSNSDEMCSIWRSAWLVALFLCLALALIALLIANCLICRSLKPGKEANQEADKLATRRQGQRREQVQAHDELDKTVRERDLRQSSYKVKRKCIEYDNNNLNYESNYDNSHAHGRQEPLRRSDQYHDGQPTGRQNESNYTRTKTRNVQYR